MTDSIGRMSVGKMKLTGRHIKRKNKEARTKMQIWRDSARRNLVRQRMRLKLKVALNRASMEDREKDREKNLNPSAFSTMLKPKCEFAADFSTVPRQPKYSKVKAKERIYGKKLRKM